MNIEIPVLSGRQAAVVQRVLSAALEAVNPRLAVQASLRVQDNRLLGSGVEADLSRLKRIRLVGIGKAAIAMAQGALDQLGDRITDGLVVAKHIPENGTGLPERIRVTTGDHPVPGPGSVASAEALAEFLEGGSEDDLVLCLISGGGSALVTLPAEGTNLEEMQELTRLLLACGASITEMNTLRKHLDRVKGGGLARMAAQARVITLILSDVIGSPLDVIASGPTVGDRSTFQQCFDILQGYRLADRVPPGIAGILQNGRDGLLEETLKPGDPRLAAVHNQVIAENLRAAEAALEQAAREGLRGLLLTTYLQGEAAQAGIFLAGILKQAAADGRPLERPACIVAGGETTVTIRGAGLGGRNQELALGAAAFLEGMADVALVTLGTDGEDGPTGAAGAVVTGSTVARARSAGLDPQAYLQNNDSNTFFSRAGGLLVTGPTGTNVNDLAFLFVF